MNNKKKKITRFVFGFSIAYSKILHCSFYSLCCRCRIAIDDCFDNHALCNWCLQVQLQSNCIWLVWFNYSIIQFSVAIYGVIEIIPYLSVTYKYTAIFRYSIDTRIRPNWLYGFFCGRRSRNWKDVEISDKFLTESFHLH